MRSRVCYSFVFDFDDVVFPVEMTSGCQWKCRRGACGNAWNKRQLSDLQGGYELLRRSL